MNPAQLPLGKLVESGSKQAPHIGGRIKSAKRKAKPGPTFRLCIHRLDHPCGLQTLEAHTEDHEIKVGPSKQKQQPLPCKVTVQMDGLKQAAVGARG